MRRPDVSVFFTNTGRGLLDVSPIPFAPDIAVEVLSLSEIAIGVNRKIREYLQAGTKEVWVVDRENAEVFIHSKQSIRRLYAEDTLDTPLLPGFKIELAELFGPKN